MPIEGLKPGDLQPGDIYEDCAYHPCLCLGAEPNGFEIWGISLVDGSYPRSCDLQHCGVRKLTLEEAWRWKRHGPPDIELDPAHRWWAGSSDQDS